jgi:hypothetical protein
VQVQGVILKPHEGLELLAIQLFVTLAAASQSQISGAFVPSWNQEMPKCFAGTLNWVQGAVVAAQSCWLFKIFNSKVSPITTVNWSTFQ